MLRDIGCLSTALRMAPPALAHTLLLAVLRGDVIHDVVWMRRISTDALGNVIQQNLVPGAPADVVIGAGRVSAHTQPADDLSLVVVECEAAAENVDAANPTPLHRIVGKAVVRSRPAVSHARIHRIAVLQPVQ